MKRIKNVKPEIVTIPVEHGSVLAEGLTFKGGSLSGVGKITINCYFVGDVSTNDLVIIDEAGSILGNIEAQSVIIRGNVKGNVEAIGEVEVRTGGVVNGNITCGSLEIATGAAFSGECNMTASRKDGNMLLGAASDHVLADKSTP